MAGNLKKEYGSRVRAARKANGLTQMQLAEALGKSLETVSNIERGKTAPSFSTMEDIAQALSFQISYFFEFENSETSRTKITLMNDLLAQASHASEENLIKINEMVRLLLDNGDR